MPTDNVHMIVAKPFDLDWIAYALSEEKREGVWVKMREGMRFPPNTRLIGHFCDACHIVRRRYPELLYTIHVALVNPDTLNGAIATASGWTNINFTDDDLCPRQMSELGIL